MSVPMCCSSSCMTLFDFLTCCGVCLVSIKKMTIQSMIWTSMLQILKYGYSSHFNFIILFVVILSLYIINLDVMSLFVNLSFMFLAMLNGILYQFEWTNIILFLSKKGKKILNDMSANFKGPFGLRVLEGRGDF